MARINTPARNANRTLTETTHEGARVAPASASQQLRRSVLACLLFEDNFYESGVAAATRIMQHAAAVPLAEVAALAVETRKVHGLRGAPLLLTNAMLFHPQYGSEGASTLIEATIKEVCDRADMPGELLAMYWKDGKRPLANPLRRGLAAALNSYNEYQLAKYANRGGIRPRDVLFLTHAKPKDKEQAALFKQLADDKLAPPDTWEVRLSSGEDKKAVFTDLLSRKKLGALATLRNLRNMRESGVDRALVRDALMRIDERARILPFQFMAAARFCPGWEDLLEPAMLKATETLERLPGKTVLLIDHSGSMQGALSARSTLNRLDAARSLAVLLREICDEVVIAAYDTKLTELPPRRGFSLADIVPRPRGGTDTGMAVQWANEQKPDRIIVFTDEQSHTRIAQPFKRGYIMNVAAYQNGIGWGKWVTISGFSEHLVRFIHEAEQL